MPKDYMTPEQMRVTIAEIRGWKNIRYSGSEFGWLGDSPEGHEQYPLPDYLNSLDAMRRVEQSLTEDWAREQYLGILQKLFDLARAGRCDERHGVTPAPLETANLWDLTTATAAQRAKAWLELIGYGA
jgi:hypothetical protein